MRTPTTTVFCLVSLLTGSLFAQPDSTSRQDWLIDSTSYHSRFDGVPDRPHWFEFSNGLVKRSFVFDKTTAVTVGLENTYCGQNVFRAVQPEALVTIDGVRYEVGGLKGQPNHAFFREEWLPNMKPAAGGLEFVGYTVGETTERFGWKRIRHHAPDVQWPPAGIGLKLEFRPDDSQLKSVGDFRVFVHYELYDGVPVFCKWLTVENRSSTAITIDRFTSELLAVVEQESRVETRAGVDFPHPESIHVETDFSFGGFTHDNANRHVVHWRTDPDYSTQVNYKRETPCLLVVEPTRGPSQTIGAGATFTSCRAFELLYDSTDRERRGLSLRRMYRTIAPWVTENPLMHHMRVADVESVRRAIDDAAEVGFEMIILSFGSGFDIENDSPAYLQQWREVAEYAREKGVEIGGYSLLSSRRIGNGNDVVSPDGESPTHGNCPALASPWGLAYYKKLYRFFEQSGFTLLEHDGPYPGDVDITARPPLQKGEADSRWVQGGIANDFYRWCREQGIYVNAPDYYFLNGSSKCGMGYREVNWSLPRSMQVIHTRQNIFDATWQKTPSMGWMFVPLSEYHGGGAAATIEPLDEHLDHYQQMMQSNLGLGVQACYRGPRLFDTDRTRNAVRRNVDWFKKYRDILESDVLHGRRADGRQPDWMLHVNSRLKEKALLTVYNPTDQVVTQTIRVNLYYTGLSNQIIIGEQDRNPVSANLDRDYCIDLPVTIPPNGMNWFVVREPRP